MSFSYHPRSPAVRDASILARLEDRRALLAAERRQIRDGRRLREIEDQILELDRSIGALTRDMGAARGMPYVTRSMGRRR